MNDYGLTEKQKGIQAIGLLFVFSIVAVGSIGYTLSVMNEPKDPFFERMERLNARREAFNLCVTDKLTPLSIYAEKYTRQEAETICSQLY